ncbi:MAG: sugar transferase [Parabacteroides sp.]|nr:sugar transferase [Parabacteroides sp.]
MKRIFDIVVSFLGLLVLSPLLIFCSLAILLGDGFPVFFRQVRVGRKGQSFWLLKFRTMSVQKGTEKGAFDAGCSARVTRVGSKLRKTKLDELPQLWNVLKGDMSLVGPRPEVRKWVDEYPEHWAIVLHVRPGITDQASMMFRNEEEILAASNQPEETYKNVILPQKLELYEEYVRTQSFLGDIKIILQTLFVLFK